MSKLEVNAVEPQCGTNLTLGASGDTIIIPSGATISNQGTAAGFGPTGAVSWNTTKITADPNPAVTGVGYFADTTSAAFTITLPASPAAGAVVGIADYANTFATNNLTVDRNGSNIGGFAANADLSTNGVSITFVYVDATQGWIVTDSGNRSDVPAPEYITATGGTITCDGDYKVHSFTGPGTFTVCSVGNPFGSDTVDYLVVAGGGGGGQCGGGGGGAGGLRSSTTFPVSVTAYSVTIGGGGAGGTCVAATSGVPTSFGPITSAGGGYAGGPAGISGGSGGGGGRVCGSVGGTGNTPPVSPTQGFPGGNGENLPVGYTGAAGGGGGSAGVGIDGCSSGGPGPGVGTAIGGPGGPGTDVTPIFGAAPKPFYLSDVANTGTTSTGYFAGGGGGNADPRGASATRGSGGIGGGGDSGAPSSSGVSGVTNSGGGGGGNNNGASSGAGGSGIVIIRYKFQN
jgi:hypothetical protein